MLLNRIPGRVHTIHNLAEKEAGYAVRRLMALAYRFMEVTPVAIADRVKDSIMTEYSLGDSRIPCIHNGIDTTTFTRIPRRSDAPIRFLHVGRMSRQKNHTLLIEAFADAVRINPDITLRLVGDGELKPVILERIRTRGCEHWIRHKGLRGDIQAELREAAVLILSSDWEGLPLSVLEAMSCGLPVIATRVGGTLEIVLDQQTGILVNPGDREALTRAILALAGDAALRERLGQRAHEHS